MKIKYALYLDYDSLRTLIVTLFFVLLSSYAVVSYGSMCDCSDVSDFAEFSLSVKCEDCQEADLCLCFIPLQQNTGGLGIKIDSIETNKTLLTALCNENEDCSSGCYCSAGKSFEVGLQCIDYKGDGVVSGYIKQYPPPPPPTPENTTGTIIGKTLGVATLVEVVLAAGGYGCYWVYKNKFKRGQYTALS